MPLDLPIIRQQRTALHNAAQLAAPALPDVLQALADLFAAQSSEQMLLRPDWQTLNQDLSQAVMQTLAPGDCAMALGDPESSEAHFWKNAAQARGVQLSWLETDPLRTHLEISTWQSALAASPRLLLLDAASPAGFIYPLPRLLRQERPGQPLVIINAHPLAAHAPLDIQRLNCDALLCCGSDLFGPPLGILYQHQPFLNSTATTIEGLPELSAALQYLEWLGKRFGDEFAERYGETFSGRPLLYKQALAAIRSYEFELSRAGLETLPRTPGLELLGPTDLRRLEERIPRFTFRVSPTLQSLAAATSLHLTHHGEWLRLEAFHYHELEEIIRFGQQLRAAQRPPTISNNQPQAL